VQTERQGREALAAIVLAGKVVRQKRPSDLSGSALVLCYGLRTLGFLKVSGWEQRTSGRIAANKVRAIAKRANNAVVRRVNSGERIVGLGEANAVQGLMNITMKTQTRSQIRRIRPVFMRIS